MGSNERNLKPTEGFSHIGVSGARLTRGRYERGGISMSIIIKKEPDVYSKEIKGARILRDYLPIIEPYGYIDRDTAIYPLIGNAQSLHDIITDPNWDAETNQLLKQYSRMHTGMWNKTHTTRRKKYIGYPNKIEETQKEVLQGFDSMSHIEERFYDPLRIKLIRHENGMEPAYETYDVDSMAGAISWMNYNLRDSLKLGTCLTHGDEGFGNCLIRDSKAVGVNYTNPLIMIDLSGAGYRSPFEPVAKMASWMSATQTEQLSYKYGTATDSSCTELIVNYSLQEKYLHIEENIKEQALSELIFLKNTENKTVQNYSNAYQMMYFLREATNYADLRQRSEVVPYLVARAFSFAADSR